MMPLSKHDVSSRFDRSRGLLHSVLDTVGSSD
jgi:hypothetical protein